MVIKNLQMGTIVNAIGGRIIKNIKRLLEMDCEVRIGHLYRETNKCVDSLANLTCVTGGGLQEFDVCPTKLSRLIKESLLLV